MHKQMHKMQVASSSVRGIFAGGYSPSNTNTIDYVTFSTLGNAQDFGDLTSAKRTVVVVQMQLVDYLLVEVLQH